ncbi:hypothetical protein QBC35DRAFT_65257 [Podospora australis]|uniref:Uncharacterized protein n=1 Tax=Podospora australis TaxID=1536484 RepID=A0AAN7AFT1_9PEZI|nr:hypothetical protein QBC35DRAFT_65257 [Podospora australis]
MADYIIAVLGAPRPPEKSHSCKRFVQGPRFSTSDREVYHISVGDIRYEQHEKECPGVVEKDRERGVLAEIDSSGTMMSPMRLSLTSWMDS